MRKSYGRMYLSALTLIVAALGCASPARPARAGSGENVSGNSAVSGDKVSADNAGIKLKGVDGKTYDVSTMSGEVVVVSFGATWCRPCAGELAALEEIKKEYQGRGVKFFWVSIESDDQTSNELLRDYAKSLKLTIPVLRDPEQRAYAQFSERVRLPLVVFFDRAGKFAAPKHTGMSAQPDEYKRLMRGRLDGLLAAK